jgi:hypothetical protein
MEDRASVCQHPLTDVDARAFTGTWTIAEIQYAQTLGYQVMNIIEVWEYESYSTDILKSFMAPMIIEKMKNKRKGLVDEHGQFTDRGLKVQVYIHELNGEVVTPDDFVDCPAAYVSAKNAVNALTGKFGQKEKQRTTRCFNEKQTAQSKRLFTNPDVDIVFAQVLDDHGDLIVIEYENKHEGSRSARQKNDHAISYITGQSRVIIHRVAHALGTNLLYMDTDSVLHKKLDTPVYKHGFRIGDLELEIPEASMFVSLGRKWYAMRLPNGEALCKLKGFTLKQSTGDKFVSERLYEHFVDCKESFDVLETPLMSAKDFNAVAPGIVIDQVLFRTEKEDVVTPFKRTVTMKKRAQFQLCSSKRFIVFPPNLDAQRLDTIITYPFGYIF